MTVTDIGEIYTQCVIHVVLGVYTQCVYTDVIRNSKNIFLWIKEILTDFLKRGINLFFYLLERGIRCFLHYDKKTIYL